MATNKFDPTKYGATPVATAAPAFDPTQYGAKPVQEKGVLGKIANDVIGVGKDVAASAVKRYGAIKSDVKNTENIYGTKKPGTITDPELALRTVGNVAGFASDIIGGVVKGGAKAILHADSAITPDIIEKPIVAKAKKTFDQTIGSEPVQKVMRYAGETYNKIPERVRKSAIEPTANIASFIPLGKGGQLAKEGVEAAAEASAKEAAKQAAKTTAKEAGSSTITSVLKKVASAPGKAVKFVGEKTGLSDKIAEGYVNPYTKTVIKAEGSKTPIEQAAKQARTQSNYEKFYAQSEKSQKDIKVKNPVDEFIVPETVKAVETKVIPARKKAGEIMGAEMEKHGKVKIDVSSTMQTLEKDLKDRANLVYDAVKKKVISTTKQSKLDVADKRFVENYVNDVNKLGANPTAADIAAFEFRNRTMIDKALNGGTIDRNTASIINKHASSLLEELNPTSNPIFKKYAEARKKYAELSNFLKEGDSVLGDESVLGNPTRLTSALKSAVTSIHSTGKKDWLLKLEALTGHKGLDDAVVALQAMKDAGDFKGRSLLDIFTQDATAGRQIPVGQKGLTQTILDASYEKAKDIVSGSPKERTMRYMKNQGETVQRAIKSQNGKVVEFPKVSRYTSKQSTTGGTFKSTQKAGKSMQSTAKPSKKLPVKRYQNKK